MTHTLAPAIPTSELYPSDAAYMARTTLFQTRMLGYSELDLDLVTAALLGLLNGRIAIRHEAVGSKEIRTLFHRAGIIVEEETLLYRTAEEAIILAEGLIRQGKRLFSPYPLTEGLFPDDSQLVSPQTYRFLNSKANLAAIAPIENLAKSRKLTLRDLAGYEWSRPVFLKGSCGPATGRGFAVQPCLDKTSYEKARKWFADHLNSNDTIIIEEWADVLTCWCVGIVVTEERTTCLGGAEQLFSSPAQQTGSMIDPENPLPEEARMLAIKIGEVARELGYRGIAGLDIGLCSDGRILVFDPNFRINSSSAQLLFYQSAASRSGLATSCSFHGKAKGNFKTLAERLEAPIEEGWFIPTRLFNGEKHPLAMGNHTVIGFVMGCHRQEAQLNVIRLQKSL